MYRTTISIWTDYDPSDVELHDLAWEAVSGDAIATDWRVEEIPDKQLPESVASFFNLLDEEDEDADN